VKNQQFHYFPKFQNTSTLPHFRRNY